MMLADVIHKLIKELEQRGDVEVMVGHEQYLPCDFTIERGANPSGKTLIFEATGEI